MTPARPLQVAASAVLPPLLLRGPRPIPADLPPIPATGIFFSVINGYCRPAEKLWAFSRA
jgi:hypothetical protein